MAINLACLVSYQVFNLMNLFQETKERKQLMFPTLSFPKTEIYTTPTDQTNRSAAVGLTELSYSVFHSFLRRAMSCRRPLKRSISSRRQISSQDFLGSQVQGLEWGLSRPTPPVRRKRHSPSSTCKHERLGWSYDETVPTALQNIHCYLWWSD